MSEHTQTDPSLDAAYEHTYGITPPARCLDCEGHYDATKGTVLCPLHASAPALLEALEAVLDLKCGDDAITGTLIEARAVIRLAKGKN